MKVNLNIVEKLVGFELPPVNELTTRVNAQLGGVEEIINIEERYAGARIVRVVSADKHPNADRLSVCLIDDGGAVADVERDDRGLVQVVCGAPNVHADMWAVWLPPRTAVPASFDEAEPFVLDARPLRGVLSQGMLAAGDELALNDDHDGIVEITTNDMPDGAELKTGASFAETFGMTGYILDIENKMFTHRPDCFGQLGVAREIAGILGHEFKGPDWYQSLPDLAQVKDTLSLDIFNDTDKSPLFTATVLDNISVGSSPLWLQCQLVAMGGKPINNIVDITNYIMLMTAQPAHAYDYDKLRGAKLGVRMAHQGEAIKLINGKEYQLTTDDIVIADGESAVGLAGIMGGSDTEVSGATKRIVLEVANFDMYDLRKTAMRHGIFTDALTRFNKGQSPQQILYVAGLAIDLLNGFGARLASDILRAGKLGSNHSTPSLEPANSSSANVKIGAEFINQRLGYDFEPHDIARLLGNVEFSVEVEGRSLNITVPFWRTDINDPEDIVEEVGRLYGFDKLPRSLPRRHAKAAPKNRRRELKQRVRESLSRTGANEVLTYSFVHENTLKKSGQDSNEAYKLSNALSPDLQMMRLTVLPSLLEKVHMNIKSGHDEFVLFEMGKGHIKMHGLGQDGLPEASNFTDLVYAAKKPGLGAPFYKVRQLLDQLGRDLNLKFVYKPIKNNLNFPVTAPFDQSRSALVETIDGKFIGMVGELKQSVIKGFKLPSYTAAATLDTAGLESAHQASRSQYKPLSRYPSTSQDISVTVRSSVKFSDVDNSVAGAVLEFDGAVNFLP